jgi:hypothetical protein
VCLCVCVYVLVCAVSVRLCEARSVLCNRAWRVCAAAQVLLLDLAYDGTLMVVVTLTLLGGIPISVSVRLDSLRGRVRRGPALAPKVPTCSCLPMRPTLRLCACALVDLSLHRSVGLSHAGWGHEEPQLLAEFTERLGKVTTIAFGLRDPPVLSLTVDVLVAQLRLPYVLCPLAQT